MNSILNVVSVCFAAQFAVATPSPSLEIVEEGDIALRLGSGWWSEQFRETSPREKRFSHAGIVVRSDLGELAVCNAVAGEGPDRGFVRLDSMTGFFKPGEDAALFRLEKDACIRSGVASNALSMLGCAFDSEFDLATTDKVYCTELVRASVNAATGEDTIPVSVLNGRDFVAIDSCYLSDGIFKVWDASATAPAAISASD